MRVTLRNVEPFNIPPVDNDEAAQFMRRVSGGESFEWTHPAAPRSMMLYEVQYAFPERSVAQGWLLASSPDELAAKQRATGKDDAEVIASAVVGRITLELGGTIDGVEVSVTTNASPSASLARETRQHSSDPASSTTTPSRVRAERAATAQAIGKNHSAPVPWFLPGLIALLVGCVLGYTFGYRGGVQESAPEIHRYRNQIVDLNNQDAACRGKLSDVARDLAAARLQQPAAAAPSRGAPAVPPSEPAPGGASKPGTARQAPPAMPPPPAAGRGPILDRIR